MTDGLIQTAIFWGQSVGGSSATEALLTPSGIAAIGLKIVGPLDDFIKAHAGFLGVTNFPSAGRLWAGHRLTPRLSRGRRGDDCEPD